MTQQGQTFGTQGQTSGILRTPTRQALEPREKPWKTSAPREVWISRAQGKQSDQVSMTLVKLQELASGFQEKKQKQAYAFEKDVSGAQESQLGHTFVVQGILLG